jgi:chemotaxis response regulator CheB
MRIAIVNDLPMAVEALRRTIVAHGAHTIAWVAYGGEEAVARAAADTPDVVLMDMIMPGVDGVEATRRIMQATPCPILVVTATVEGNASRVYDALGHGALDAVNTPRLGRDGTLDGAAELLRKIAHIDLLRKVGRSENDVARSSGRAPPPTAEPAKAASRPDPNVDANEPAAPAASPAADAPPILAIGASTGGPQAIAAVLAALPRPWTPPILVVQHLGAEFVPGFGEWIAQHARMPVEIVHGRVQLREGTIHLAGREEHLVCDARRSATLKPGRPEELHCPSVDALFASLAAVGAVGVAVLLTGMGRDGAAGLLELRRRGWWTIAQDRATSVVWGMPGEACRLGAASETLPVTLIGAAIGAAFAREAWTSAGHGEGSRR